MRLLLDAHVSGRRLGEALRSDGHDVLALTDRPELEGTDDEEVLAMAAAQGRILITHNVRDFAPLLVEWAELGREHAGCVLIRGIDHARFGLLLRGLRALFEARPTEREWRDLVLWLTPGGLDRP